MNKTLREVLIFAAGFGCGAYFMHTLFREKYQEYADHQIEDVREHYQEKEAEMDKTIEERATQKSFEQLAGKYRTESDPEDVVEHDPIEIIEPDHFGEDEDYETCFVSYYADGKVVFDGESRPLDDEDISKTIGTEALKHIGEFMPSAIHVRNHNYHEDYEIMQVRQNWSDIDPSEEDE